MTPQDYLEAARVPKSLQPQQFGFWTIQRKYASQLGEEGQKLRWDDYTLLRRISMASLHLEEYGGEIVMEDSITELRQHLPIWMKAVGRVLVTGLGLGCVVRGLLASPWIEHIDVIEIDPDIIRVVGAEFKDNPRVQIHEGDALKVHMGLDTKWDFAWHDIWCDGDDHLQTLHTKLLIKFGDRCTRQGAWKLPRFMFKVAPGLANIR